MTKPPKKHAGGRPRVKHPRVNVAMRFDPTILERLDALAAREGTTRTALIQLAVSQMLKQGIDLRK